MAPHVNSICDLNSGSVKCIYKCKSKRYGLKKNILHNIGLLIKKNFLLFTSSGTVYLDCGSRNVIYFIICSRCSLQYVGMIGQKRNERFDWQKTCFNNPKKMAFVRYCLIIFIKAYIKMVYVQSQILEKLGGNGRTACLSCF